METVPHNPYEEHGLPSSELPAKVDVFSYWDINEIRKLNQVKADRLRNVVESGYPNGLIGLSDYALEVAGLVEPESKQIQNIIEARHHRGNDIEAKLYRNLANRALNEIVKRNAIHQKVEKAYDTWATYKNENIKRLRLLTADFSKNSSSALLALESIAEQNIVQVLQTPQGRTIRKVVPIIPKTWINDSENILRVVYANNHGIEIPGPQSHIKSVE